MMKFGRAFRRRQVRYLGLLIGLGLFLFPGTGSTSVVRTEKSSAGWKLLVDGRSFFVQGMCYYPAKVGESSSEGTLRDWMIVDDDHDGRMDSPYQSWVDKNGNNIKDKDEKEVGDFQLLKDMGCNVIRVYHHSSAKKEIQELNTGISASLLYNHGPNKELLRDLFRTYGIRVAMGDLLGSYCVGSGADWNAGTDYSDRVQKKEMLASVADMVREFKDEPFILMWILGNENNYSQLTHTNAAQKPEAWAKFVNEAAKLIKKMDPNHPVCLANGETQLIKIYARFSPDVDIFGLNSYRSQGFGGLWEDLSRIYDKPVLLTEFGVGYPRIRKGILNETHQSRIHQAAFCDMLKHAAGMEAPGNAIGGFVYEFLDNWWQNGDPEAPNLSETGWNNEITGMAGQGDGKNSPFLRQLRQVYFMYKSLWTGEGKCE